MKKMLIIIFVLFFVFVSCIPQTNFIKKKLGQNTVLYDNLFSGALIQNFIDLLQNQINPFFSQFYVNPFNVINEKLDILITINPTRLSPNDYLLKKKLTDNGINKKDIASYIKKINDKNTDTGYTLFEPEGRVLFIYLYDKKDINNLVPDIINSISRYCAWKNVLGNSKLDILIKTNALASADTYQNIKNFYIYYFINEMIAVCLTEFYREQKKITADQEILVEKTVIPNKDTYYQIAAESFPIEYCISFFEYSYNKYGKSKYIIQLITNFYNNSYTDIDNDIILKIYGKNFRSVIEEWISSSHNFKIK